MKRKDIEGLATLFGNQVAVLAQEAELVGKQEARIAGLMDQLKYRDAQVARSAKMLADAQAIIERGTCAFDDLEYAFVLAPKPEPEESEQAADARASARNNACILARRWKADGRKWCMELGLKIGPIT